MPEIMERAASSPCIPGSKVRPRFYRPSCHYIRTAPVGQAHSTIGVVGSEG